MYANQAILLGIRPIIICNDSSSPNVTHYSTHSRSFLVDKSFEDDTIHIHSGENSFHWTYKYWQQGPRMTKLNNITLHPEIMVDILGQLNHDMIQLQSNNRFNHNCNWYDEWNEVFHKLTICIETIKNASAEDISNTFPLPMYEIYITTVLSEKISDSQYQISLMGEIVAKQPYLFEPLVSMEHLSVCIVSVLTSLKPWCTTVGSFNYYAHLKLVVTHPVHRLHVWLQATPSGGKFKWSDSYVSLDTRIDETAGFKIHSDAIGYSIEISLQYLDSDTLDWNNCDDVYSNKCHNTFDQSHSINKELFVATRYTIQHFTSYICKEYRLNFIKCSMISTSILIQVYQAVTLQNMMLPPIQILPTPQRPFVFIHIEKSAGTTLRE
jgi:hypothetical protein